MHKDVNETGIEHWKFSTVQGNENTFQLKHLCQIKKLNWNRNKHNLQCNKTYEFHICTLLLSVFVFIFCLFQCIILFTLYWEENKVDTSLKNEGSTFELLMENIILLR